MSNQFDEWGELLPWYRADFDGFGDFSSEKSDKELWMLSQSYLLNGAGHHLQFENEGS